MRRKALVLLAFFLAPLASQAQGPGCSGPSCNPFPWVLDSGVRFHFQLVPAGGPQLGPWYNYWPLEAHFQTPAPPAYPYWPQGGHGVGGPVGGPGGAPAGGPNVMAPPGPGNFHGNPVTPVSWMRNSVPHYWGR